MKYLTYVGLPTLVMTPGKNEFNSVFVFNIVIISKALEVMLLEGI